MTTILLIEDTIELAAAIRRVLESENYRVVHAADGPAGLAAALQQKPDLIVLDWMLPGMDGLEVLRRIRQSSPVPVLMLTARKEEIDRVIGLEVGADDYLTKPFGMRELIARCTTRPGGMVGIFVKSENGSVQIDVRDTGSEMSPDEIERIWEPFFQGAGERSEDTVGLGLALVKELTERMGGTVSASSLEGEGSCFSVRFLAWT